MTTSKKSLRFFDEFRQKDRVLQVANLLREESAGERELRFMEFCGGHTQVFFRYGLSDLLPENIRLIHGPGCPVCVLPRGRIDSILTLADRYPNAIICTYADLMRIPASKGLNLLQKKAAGADIRMIYSPSDAVRIAQQNSDRAIVFVAIGFETTAPSTAVALLQAERLQLKNFFVYCLHLLTPPAISHVIQPSPTPVELDGFIGPGHVSTVIGANAYRDFTRRYRKPLVISGFAPLDMMQSILMLVRLIKRGEFDACETQYKSCVSAHGNPEAQRLMKEVFSVRPHFEWRGLGDLPESSLQLGSRYEKFDAEREFQIEEARAKDHPACLCGEIIRGRRRPPDCRLFRKACTPDNPLGPCMVSSEGSCAAYITRSPQSPTEATHSC